MLAFFCWVDQGRPQADAHLGQGLARESGQHPLPCISWRNALPIHLDERDMYLACGALRRGAWVCLCAGTLLTLGAFSAQCRALVPGRMTPATRHICSAVRSRPVVLATYKASSARL